MKKFGFLLPFLLPPLVVGSAAFGGGWTLLTLGVVFGLLPALDLVLGEDTSNPDAARVRVLENQGYYRSLLYLYVPVHFGLILWGAATVGAGRPWLEMLGITLSIGVVSGGIGITVAHELGHRLSKLDRTLACAMLSGVGYMHFYIEHNKGHHARVATPEDPASARLGESFYRFLPRTLGGSFSGAWRIEAERLERRGCRVGSVRNRMLWAVGLPLLATVFLGAAFGVAGAAFFLLQCAVAITLLELVNYIEHYGLRRRLRTDGSYERVSLGHSWNSSAVLTNFFLFNLQRHSHHHVAAPRRYQALEHYEQSPQLPTGYAGMIPVALAPPLWRKLMDPRVEALAREQG